jgi:hypothetical protein
MTTACYSAIYGDYDTIRPQPVPVRLFTDSTLGYRRSGEPIEPRLAAKWWKLRPDLACPDADVTIWIDGNVDVLRPDFLELCTDALGDADALFVRHTQRDDIYEEVTASRMVPRKYDGMPLEEQVESYRAAGHPEHWGLVHAAVLVRRNCTAVRALDEAWWAENVRWSVQDQLSLPPLLRMMPLNWRWWDISPITAGWVHWDGGHEAVHAGRAA